MSLYLIIQALDSGHQPPDNEASTSSGGMFEFDSESTKGSSYSSYSNTPSNIHITERYLIICL